MWIQREITDALRTAVATRPAVVLTGARQTGKSALVRRTFPDHGYVSLDLPAAAELAERSPAAFLGQHPRPLIVDEVQYAPSLFRHLKQVIDSDRETAGQFLLTGSQPFELMQGIGDSLAGRVAVLQLEGLSWRECRQALPNASIEDLLWRGGFPELYANPAIDVAGYHAAYVATYLERDLRNLLQVGSLRDFARFLRAAAGRTAGLLNMADLGRDVGITAPTAKSWISVLERSGQIALLEPWFSNHVTGLTKSPKLHCCDSGIASFLTAHRSPGDLLDSPMIGGIWESAVFAELRKAQINRGERWDLQYFRNRTRELDFCYHRAGRLTVADAKWAEQPTQRDAKQVMAVMDILGEHCREPGYVICRSLSGYPLADRVTVCSPDEARQVVGR